METVEQIKARIGSLAVTIPVDDDPYAEARVEALYEKSY